MQRNILHIFTPSRYSMIPLFAWILFLATFSFLLAILFWSYFGNIPIKIEGRGILIPASGLTSVQSKLNGTVTHIYATPESIVKKGELLLEIRNYQIELKYEEAKLRVSSLKSELAQLRQDIDREAKAETQALKIKIKAAEYSIAQLTDVIDFLNRELKTRTKLAEEGLITSDLVIEASQNITLKKIQLEEKIAELANLRSQYKKEYRPEEYRTKEQQLLSEEQQRDLLQIAIDSGKIYSPQNGKILEVLVNPGDEVQLGKALVWMEYLEDEAKHDYIIYGFFPVDMGKRIQLKMNVEMAVSTVNYKEYGYLKGTVEDVSLFAVTKDNILSKIHNRVLVDYLTNQSTAVVQIAIRPEKDPQDPSRFLWTSQKQPPVVLTSGTVGTLRATVEKIRPLYYLLPLPQIKYQKMGSEL